MLKRIKYVSHFACPLSAQEIDEIALVSQKNNMESGITGVLMTSGGLFFQILEGPAGAVDRLFEVILEDPRHKDILLLNAESNVQRRLFPDYSMKTISLRSSTEDRLAPVHALLEAVVVQRKLIDRLVSTVEQSVWQEYAWGSARSEAPELIDVPASN